MVLARERMVKQETIRRCEVGRCCSSGLLLVGVWVYVFEVPPHGFSVSLVFFFFQPKLVKERSQILPSWS